MGLTAYFANIADAVKTTFEGLAVTLSYMVKRPTTVQYPDRLDQPVVESLPERYRGFLAVDPSLCTGCSACKKACPVACIEVTVEKDAENPKQRYITRFDIDISKCLFCGLCVEGCPTGAVVHTREFEGSTYNLEDLVFRFIGERVPVAKPKKKAVAKKAAPAKAAEGKEEKKEDAKLAQADTSDKVKENIEARENIEEKPKQENIEKAQDKKQED